MTPDGAAGLVSRLHRSTGRVYPVGMEVVCPQCWEPIPWLRRVLGDLPGLGWTCKRCGARLRWHPSNYFLRLIPFVVYAVFFGLLRWARLPMTAEYLTLILATIPLICVLALIGQRVQIVEFGAGHCRNCGYDLTGLTSGRCPECGAPTDSDGVSS